MKTAEHATDADCTVNPATGCCNTCGIWHPDPCPDCGGGAFHWKTCPQMLAEELAELLGIEVEYTGPVC